LNNFFLFKVCLKVSSLTIEVAILFNIVPLSFA